jgi:hypothetical protein
MWLALRRVALSAPNARPLHDLPEETYQHGIRAPHLAAQCREPRIGDWEAGAIET